MSFLVQDDNGTVDNANAYVTVAFVRAYFTDRGVSTASFTDQQLQEAIVRATDYLDGRFLFPGERGRPEQRTQWPRIDAEYSDDDRPIFGVPVEIEEACSEYTLIAAAQEINPTPTRDATGQRIQSKSETVGPISTSVSYVGGAAFSLPAYPKADLKLRRVTLAGGEVYRG